MAKTQTLKFKRTLGVSPAAVYRALTNATALREWFCDAALVEPHKGGRLYLGWNQGYYATGEFTKLDPDRKVAFTWLGRGDYALIDWEDLMSEVQDVRDNRTVDYLIGTPLLADYLEEGLDKLGISVEDAERGVL